MTPYPKARTNDLILQEMDHELVVYDNLSAQANLLNRTAAVIWKQCDGKTGVDQIAARASTLLGAPVDAALVWYTLEQLSKKNLLQDSPAVPTKFVGLSRRDFLRAGLVGAAVVIPAIVSVTAPTAAHAASCIDSGDPCQASEECCSGLCDASSCA